jgi:hypothetical protein
LQKRPPAPKPVRDVSEAQKLLHALQRICAAKVDSERLPELLCKTLEGIYTEVAQEASEGETSGEDEAPPVMPVWREGRRASV